MRYFWEGKGYPCAFWWGLMFLAFSFLLSFVVGIGVSFRKGEGNLGHFFFLDDKKILFGFMMMVVFRLLTTTLSSFSLFGLVGWLVGWMFCRYSLG
jgi:hypothetical protein